MNNHDSLLKTVRSAMNSLARREHSYQELRDKLLRKGFDAGLIDQTLTKLQTDHLLSDQRFAESFVQSRVNRGQGPVRIKQELQDRGVDPQLMNIVLQNYDNHTWQTLAIRVRHQRFGESLPQDAQARTKQFRFLQQRGFTSEQIRIALNTATADQLSESQAI